MVPNPSDLDENSGTSADCGSTNVPDLDSVTKTEDRQSDYRSPETKVFDGERWRESTRTFLSLALFLSICLTQILVLAFVSAPLLLPFVVPSEKSKEQNEDKNVVKLGDSAFIYVVKNEEEGKASKELITLIWTSQVTLIGSALGFYFAANRDNNSSKTK
ncbi:hypothetical protein GS682_24730 [Nostoc sp. B(2019)]|nr:hypothetical protein [Nostoc sp. B(2019)]